MFGKRFLSLATLAAVFLGAFPGWAAVVEEEAVFGQVSRVAKKYNNCTNNGNTYTLEVTGQVAGVEKTISVPSIAPDPASDEDGARAEGSMARLCEKAALLTKSQPEKHDFYISVRYQLDGGGGPSSDGLCTSTGTAVRVRGTQLTCELR